MQDRESRGNENRLRRRRTPRSCRIKVTKAVLGALISLTTLSPICFAATPEKPRRLKVSENKHFLVYDDGRPFFYLGDTAWELFHRLNREEADKYLSDRAHKQFTVIQAVALAELDGLNSPNAYGHRPFIDNDPTKPDVKDGPQNDYWDQVDYVVDRAEALGLYIGMLPTWGDKWNRKGGAGPEVFTPDNAAVYGEWLGRRYRDKPIIWILGGDRAVENDRHRQILKALADGLRKGDGGNHLITLHPPGGQGSSTWFQNDAWLDFNLRQNGHVIEFTDRYEKTRLDYDKEPTKPVIDGEPIYEDHPVSFNAKKLGHSTAADVRRPLYWDLFSGACGHTYGHHSVWQMWAPGRQPVNDPLMSWGEALDQPGAGQMQHARHLLESRPYLSRIPDDSLIVESSVKTAIPGAGSRRFVATRDEAGSYALVYAPIGRAFKVNMERISGSRVNAWWFNPRDGSATFIGEFPNSGQREFVPPDKGEQIDWVLVLDDVARRFARPGQTQNAARYFELRIYDVKPEKMEAVLARFRDHIGRIRAKHGIETLGYWTSVDMQHGGKFVYVIAAEDERRFKTAEKEFAADPEFQQAYAASAKANGETVDKITSFPMRAVDCSPRAKAGSSSARRVFELRIYDVAAGKMEALLNNYRDARLALFEKHGFSNVGLWASDGPDGQHKLIVLLAHQSAEAIDKAKAAYHANPEWKSKVDEWNKVAGPITTSVISLKAEPTAFSPVH